MYQYHHHILPTQEMPVFGDGVGVRNEKGEGNGGREEEKIKRSLSGKKSPHWEMLNKLKAARGKAREQPTDPRWWHSTRQWPPPTGKHPIRGNMSTKQEVWPRWGGSPAEEAAPLLSETLSEHLVFTADSDLLKGPVLGSQQRFISDRTDLRHRI